MEGSGEHSRVGIPQSRIHLRRLFRSTDPADEIADLELAAMDHVQGSPHIAGLTVAWEQKGERLSEGGRARSSQGMKEPPGYFKATLWALWDWM